VTNEAAKKVKALAVVVKSNQNWHECAKMNEKIKG